MFILSSFFPCTVSLFAVKFCADERYVIAQNLVDFEQLNAKCRMQIEKCKQEQEKINYRHRLTQINTDDKNQQC